MHDAQVYKTVSRACWNLKEGHTIQIRECPVVLVFHQHVTELDLCTIHILSNDEQFRGSPRLNLSVGDDIPDLNGQRAIQFRED